MAKATPKVSIRKPPPAKADAFVAGAPPTGKGKASRRPNVQASRRSTQVTRKDGRELRRLTVYLPTDLARRLAVHCAEMDAELSAVITAAVSKHLR